MEATEFFIKFSAHYPAIVRAVLIICALASAVCVLYGAVCIVRLEVWGTLSPTQMGWGKIAGIFIVGGLFGSIAWTMNAVGDTFFDYGGYILRSFDGTEQWKVREGQSDIKVIKDFTVVSARLIGLLFGLWGLITAFAAMRPNAGSAETDKGLWPAFVRLLVGAALFDLVWFFDLFGGWGTKYLT